MLHEECSASEQFVDSCGIHLGKNLCAFSYLYDSKYTIIENRSKNGLAYCFLKDVMRNENTVELQVRTTK